MIGRSVDVQKARALQPGVPCPPKLEERRRMTDALFANCAQSVRRDTEDFAISIKAWKTLASRGQGPWCSPGTVQSAARRQALWTFGGPFPKRRTALSGRAPYPFRDGWQRDRLAT